MTDRSHPSLKISIELKSNQAQRIHHWVHTRIGEMFFMTEVVYAQHPHMQEAITKKQEIIIHKLDQLDQRLQNRTSELYAQIQEDKQSFDAGTPKTITLNCTTPESQCSAPLLIHFDQLVLMYERLWLMRLLTRKEAVNVIEQWTLVVSETIHDCQQLYLQLQNKTQKKGKKA